MIETGLGFDARVKVQQIIENQLPEFILDEYSKFPEFLKQYYISQEFQGGPVDIAENLDQYIRLDNLTPEVIVGSTNITSQISTSEDTIQVLTTKGFPNQYGLLKIDDEIVTYTGITTNSFLGCVRGFSGITSYHSENDPSELVFSQSQAASHNNNSSVQNLSALFLKEFYKKIKFTFTPGLEDTEFVPELDVSNFIKESRSFYQSKGTEESFRILFKILYGEIPKVVDLEDFLIKPSSAAFSRRKVLIVDRISGDPLKLLGQTIRRTLDPTIQGSVSESEIITRKNKSYYKLSLFVDYNDDGDSAFIISGKTKSIESVSIGSSIITVDSTIGFDPDGSIISGNNIIQYTSKNVNQFLGCTGVTSIINPADDIRSNETVFGYEDGDITKLVEMRITGVLSNFVPTNDILVANEQEVIRVKNLGELIENPFANKTYKQIFANTWIYNTSSRYQVSNISGSTFTLISKIDKSSLRLNDNVEVLVRGTQNIVSSNASIININVSNNQIILNNLGAFVSVLGFEYDIRRKLKKAVSNGANLEFGNNNLINDIQNLYDDNDEYAYVASNSLPGYVIDKNIIASSITQASPPRLQDYNVLTERYSIISFQDNVEFITGDAIVYDYDSTPMPGLSNQEIYYVEVLSQPNQIRLYSTRAFIGGPSYVTFGGVSAPGSHRFILEEHKTKLIGPQRLLKKFSLSQNFNITSGQEVNPGSVGMLVNGVEILHPKTNNKIYYGLLESSNILNGGSGYDVINPPDIAVSLPTVGTAASIVPVVRGSVDRVYVDPQDFDIQKVISVTITGGNGIGAILEPVLSKRNREIEFDARNILLGGGLDLSNETITFLAPHNFLNGEQIVYNPNGNLNLGIGTFGPPDSSFNKVTGKLLVTGSSYFARIINPKSIQLYETFNDYFVGLNTVGFTTENAGGIHKFRTLSKTTLKSIRVINSGSGYQNRKLYVKPVGISTIENTVSFENHNFNAGDIVEYYSTQTSISGLSTSNQYYIIKIDNNTFNLANAGLIGSSPDNNDYTRKKIIKFGSTGSGYHVFRYPEIKVSINVSYGSSLVGVITATPRVTGSIIDTYLIEKGTGYGSSILNLEKKPIITIKNGKNAEVNPIIRGGKIIKVDVLTGGSEYVSAPELVINGPGAGAILRPVINNQRLEKVIVINSGSNYDEDLTSVTVKSSGSGALLDTRVRSLTLNDGYRNGTDILVKSPLDNLKYAVVGYSTVRGLTEFGDNGQEHSPIIGWAYDGNPIYGPWGYSNPEDSDSLPKALTSGYTLNILNVQDRPVGFAGGFFIEDYAFSDSGDLDINNGRFCKTPEFQNGTYAYFASVTTDLSTNTLKPIFPYFIGNTFRNKFIEENLFLDQSFDFNNSNLVRNTFPYKVNDPYADNDFLIESNEVVNQLSVVESTLKGRVDSLKITETGSEYKVGDAAVFDDTDTGGGGLTATVKEIKGKQIQRIDTSILEYANSSFAWKDRSNILVKVNDYHIISENDNVVVSGLSTSISKLFGIHKTGISSETAILFKQMPSNVIAGFVTDIYVSKIPSNISIGSSIQIKNEILRVLNVYRDNSVLRAVRSDVGTAHSLSTLVSFLPDKITLPVIVDYFDSKINNLNYFNPHQSVGVGTTTGYSISVSYSIGETPKEVSIPIQSIYIPNHPFKTGDGATLTKKTATFPLIVGNTAGGSTFNLPFTTNSEQVYVINKGKDYIGLATVRTGISSSAGLYFFNNASDNYEYSLETNYNEVTGNVQKITTLVSLSTTHGLEKGDVIKLDVKPNLSVGIGTSTFVKVKYNSQFNKLLIDPVGFDSSNINVSSNIINLTQHGYSTGDKVFYNSSDLIASGLSTGGYFIYKIDSNNIQLGETLFDVSKNYPNIVNIVGAGGSSHELSLINPEIDVVRNGDLVFNVSDSSLLGYDFKIYYDSAFTNEFVSIKTEDQFNVLGIGSVGIGSTSTVTLNYSEEFPSRFYYNLEKTGETNIIDDSVSNHTQITYVNSRYNSNYSVVSSGTTTFTISPLVEPESLVYRRIDCDTLEYTTNSATATGGVSKMSILFSGSGYKSLPKFIEINSEDGIDADIVAISTSIGKLKDVRILDQGFEYSSDKTLRPEAYISPIINLEKSNYLVSVNVSSGGKNYASPPDLLLFDTSSNTIVDSDSLTASIFSSSVATVDIISDITGLDSITHRVIAINNSNGVAISSVTSSLSGILTCTLSTPVLSGFLIAPFDVGDEIFVEGIEKQGTSGSGFNSEDYNYQFFKVSSYTNSNPAILEFDLSEVATNAGIAKSVQNGFAVIINKKNYPVFEVVQDFAIFSVGEKILSDTGIGFFERDLIVIDAKKEYIKVSGTYVLEEGEVIKGKQSGIFATVLSVVNNRGRFEIGFAIDKDFGWNNDIGKLSEDYQVVSDNDYYQNLSYTVKSSVEYSEMINPVNRLLHSSGLKNFSDTQIESKATINYNFETNDLIILDIIEEKRVDTINNFDLVVDVDVDSGRSKFVKTKNRRLVDYIKCLSNNVLLVDNISDGFSNRESILDLYADIKKLNDSYYRFLVQIRDPNSGNIEINELIVLSTDKDVYTLQKGTLSTNGETFGELEGSIDQFDTKSLRFTPDNPFDIDYDIKVIENIFNSSVAGLNTSSIGFISLTASNVNVGVGSTATIYFKDINNIETICANIEITNKVTNKSSYVELFVGHDGQDTYISEYYFDNIIGITTSFMGTFNPYIDNNILYLDYESDESNELLIRSKIIGIGTTGNGTGNYRYLVPGQIPGNERSAFYNANYTVSSGPETVISCNNDECGSIKSLVKVSYGQTSAIHQILTIIDGVNGYINQYPFVSIGTTSGIGTFGIESSGLTSELKFYPDPSVLSPVKVQSYNEVLYLENDNFNIPPELQYGPVTEIITLSAYESINGSRVNKLDFDLNYQGVPIFAKTFNPSNTSGLNKSTGIFTIPNHFFRTGERLIYTPKSTFIGVGATSVGIGSTANSVGIVTNILPREVYAIELNSDQFRISTRREYANAGIYVTFTSSGSGNAHELQMFNKNEKSIISVNGVVQKPINYTPVSHTLRHNFGPVSAASTVFSLSGISSIRPTDLIKVDDEYMGVIAVGFGSTPTGPITGIGTYQLISVNRGFVGSDASSHTNSTESRVYRGSYNISGNNVFFTEAPKGRGSVKIDNTNIPYPTSNFEGRVYLRNNYSENIIYDDISDQFTGIAQTFRLTVGGINTTGYEQGSGILFINDIFQTPTTLNNAGNNYEIAEAVGVTTITFTGITSINGSLIKSDFDINQNSLPRGGIIISLGSTPGLGYAALKGAQVGVITGAGGQITGIIGIGTTGAYNSLTGFDYNKTTGISTVSTTSPHGLLDNDSISFRNIKFECPDGYAGFSTVGISSLFYSNVSGFMTVTTSSPHKLATGMNIRLRNLEFSCSGTYGITTSIFPDGTQGYIFTVASIVGLNTFGVNVGTSTIGHNYVNGGTIESGITTNIFPDSRGIPFSISNFQYDKTSGVSTITFNNNHNFKLSDTIKVVNAKFDCPISAGTTIGITSSQYSKTTGILTVTTATPHGLGVGGTTRIFDMNFSCPSGSSGITTTVFPDGSRGYFFPVNLVGFPTQFTTNVGTSTITHDYVNGGYIQIGVTTDRFPDKDRNLTIVSIPSANQIITNVGVSTITHDYVSDGYAYAVKITGPYKVTRVINSTQFETNVYTVGFAHTYISGGEVSKYYNYQTGSGYRGEIGIAITSPTGNGANITAFAGIGGTLGFNINSSGSGYGFENTLVFVPDPCYENLPVIGISRRGIGSTTDTGIGLLITLDVSPSDRTSGIGSTLFQVSSFKISRPGYAFKPGDVFKPVGLVTAKGLAAPIENFELTVLDTFTDSFSLWQFGELDFIDSVKPLQNGTRVRFPLSYNGELLSFEKDPLDARSSSIDLDSVLLIFINGVIQKPKSAYTFEGGTSFVFTDPPKPEDNVSIFFYRGTRNDDTVEQEIIETIKIGDDIQIVSNNLNLLNTVEQEIRRVDDIVGSDKIETNIYSGLGVDDTNFKPLYWTKQKRDKIIKGDPVYKVRDSIEPLIYPTARVIKTVNTGDPEIFVDDARFFEYEESALGVTIPDFDALLIQGTDVVAAGVSAIVSAAGTISGFTLNEQGSGYEGATVSIKIAPPLSVGAGIGTTATATASIVGGKVSSPFTIANPGFGYSQTNPPEVIIEAPTFKYENIKNINVVEGFTGIITGISTSTGIGGHPLAIKFFANTTSFSGLSNGYPIYVFDTFVGHGVTSVINSNSDVVGIGTTFLNNVYYVSNISAAGPNAVITCNVKTNTRITGVSAVGFATSPAGRFSWGRFSLLERSTSNPISIGVSGLTVDSGLSTFPVLQRRGYGIRDSGALRN